MWSVATGHRPSLDTRSSTVARQLGAGPGAGSCRARSILLGLLLLGREVLGGPLLALGLQRAVRDHLADRQREILGGRVLLLVDLLDSQNRNLQDEREKVVTV